MSPRLHLSVLRKLATASLNSLGFWRGISCEALLIVDSFDGRETVLERVA